MKQWCREGRVFESRTADPADARVPEPRDNLRGRSRSSRVPSRAGHVDDAGQRRQRPALPRILGPPVRGRLGAAESGPRVGPASTTLRQPESVSVVEGTREPSISSPTTLSAGTAAGPARPARLVGVRARG